MRTVLIMLSTYNGEKYLKEQLDSLYSQKNVDIHILVRDDGSEDRTVQILDKFLGDYGRMTILKAPNIGASRSFYKLIEFAYENMPRYDFYSFCDQDDVWFENKLDYSCSQINPDSDIPELFYSSAVPVDANLKPLKHSCLKGANCLGANIVSSRALGCTQTFNYALLQKIEVINRYADSNQDRNTYVPLHDGWASLVAFALGNVWIGKEPLMYYRQHGKNVVGTGKRGLKSIVDRIQRNRTGCCRKSKKCQILLGLLSEYIPQKNIRLIEACAHYKKNIWSTIRLLFTRDLYHFGLIDNLGTFCLILSRNF